MCLQKNWENISLKEKVCGNILVEKLELGNQIFDFTAAEAEKYSTWISKTCLFNAFFTNIKNGCLKWGLIIKNYQYKRK